MAVAEQLPTGFRRSAAGLIVPDEHSRARRVWSYQDWQKIERATKFLEAEGIQVFFRCDKPACQTHPMERLRRADGGITMRCDHMDREVTKL